MVTIEEMEAMLDEIAMELPQEFYKELNGGILLLPEAKFHEQSQQGDLYIMGEYYRGGNMGRYIAIYYGSFAGVYGHLAPEHLKEQLRSTLKHEFRHHLESLGGERDLEKIDEKNISNYLNKNS
ncbi:MAG: metallopeptidase family protein [Bacillota bacterium]